MAALPPTENVSLSGSTPEAMKSCCAYVPSVSLVSRRASLPSGLVTYLIAPPIVLRPYSVPCGPRSTSRRSMS